MFINQIIIKAHNSILNKIIKNVVHLSMLYIQKIFF